MAMAVFAFCLPAAAEWRIDQTRYLNYLRTTGYSGGSAQGPCQYATLADCQNAIRAYASQMGDSHFASMAECVECGGSNGSGSNFQGTPEQQLAFGLVGALIKSIFAKPDTSRQDEIERQNALKRQQEEEQRKEAARLAANQAWIDLQNQEKEQRKIAEANKKAAGQDLLGKIETVGGGELELKTIGTDFFQAGAVDLNGKKGTVKALTGKEEQARRDQWYEEQIQEQGFSGLAPIPENGIEESAVPATKFEDSKEYKIVDAYLDQIAKFPGGQLPAYIGKIMLTTVNQTFISINATTAAIVNGTPPPEEVANGTVVQNIIYKTAESMTIDKAVDIGKNIASKLGIGYLSALYGKSTEATTKLALELGEDTKTIVEIWFAKRY